MRVQCCILWGRRRTTPQERARLVSPNPTSSLRHSDVAPLMQNFNRTYKFTQSEFLHSVMYLHSVHYSTTYILVQRQLKKKKLKKTLQQLSGDGVLQALMWQCEVLRCSFSFSPACIPLAHHSSTPAAHTAHTQLRSSVGQGSAPQLAPWERQNEEILLGLPRTPSEASLNFSRPQPMSGENRYLV
jgi:hypothetical protein